jgi:hypothetical protein
MSHPSADVRPNTDPSFEIVPVWRNVSPELIAELSGLWAQTGAIADPASAAARGQQAVCIGRDANGAICAVGTAVIRTLPRLRQPMYFYRQFFAPGFRGQRQTVPFFRRACDILQAHDAQLAIPEALGVLVELESALLAARYVHACDPHSGTTFIGYSPRGLQLRVSYFDDARLLAPAMPGRRRDGGRSSRE